MTIRHLTWTLIVAAAVLCVGGVAALATWRALAPIPTLDSVRALARAQKFAEAQAILERHLRRSPQNERAHLLMAQLTTEPKNAHPDLALEHLQAVRADGPKQAALLKFVEGKARYQQGRYDLAEECWVTALRLDPRVPEAGWVLIDLLDKEGRVEEAHRLGMRMHELEPDPRDRVRILLEMSRLDIEAPESHSQIELFEGLHKQHPENLPLALTVGLALVRFNRCEEGLALLETALRCHPGSPETWDTWLSALSLTAETDKLAEEFARVPRALASDARFAKHEGMVAQIARDWPRAVRAYRRAFVLEPYNQGVIYRFRFVLRQAGETAEHDHVDRIYNYFKDAFLQVRGSYFESNNRDEDPNILQNDFKATRGAYYETVAMKTLGLKPHPELYQRLADLREKMGRPDEARAWHRLVLRDSPDNAMSLAALERLK